MAYNNLSGTVLLPDLLTTRVTLAENSIVSGNLSTSDGAEIINVPRVSNATNNAIVTNVGGNANTLTCESNLTFDGDTLNITGDMTASIGVKASFFEGDGSRLTGISSGISYSRRAITTNATASTTDTLLGVSGAAAIQIQLPSAGDYQAGQYFTIKDESGAASSKNVTVIASGSQTIDGQNSIVLESPYAAIQLYSNGTDKFFVF